MLKKILAFMIFVSIAAGACLFPANASASPAGTIRLKTAREIASFYLATLEPVRVDRAAGARPVRLNGDFELTAARPLYNAAGQIAFYSFDFTGTAAGGLDGYITVSLCSDLPYIMEHGFSPSPYSGEGIEKTFYISPLVYFNKTADGRYLDKNANAVTFAQVKECFDSYGRYRQDLALANSPIIKNVLEENEATLSAVKQIKADGLLDALRSGSFFENLRLLLDYYLGSVWHWGDVSETNKAVEDIIKNHAGAGYTISSSSVVDKTYMIPQTQHYYDDYVGSGICGKASSMMVLAFYRDGRGFDVLPADETMYEELSAVYDSITAEFPFFFANAYVNEELGLSQSYEMLGTLDMGLAYYLYSKGYKEAAQNVIDNACFDVTMVPDLFCRVLMKALWSAMSGWLTDKSNGELSFANTAANTANNAIVNSLKKGEPVVIGCLAAVGCDWFSNHYFAGVGYYEAVYDAAENGGTAVHLNKEYVEVYDTWGHDSSVINWSVFKSTALYSSTSLADVTD